MRCDPDQCAGTQERRSEPSKGLQRGGPRTKIRGAGWGKKVHKSTDPKIRHNCVNNFYGDIWSVLWWTDFPTLYFFVGYQWNLQSVLPRCAPRILSSWASRRSRRTGLEELVTCRIWINWSQCHIIISEHTSRLLIKVQTKNDSINIWIKLCQLVGHNLYCKHPTKMCWKDNIPLFDNVICISQII